MAENRRPSRSGVAHMGLGQPRVHDNNNYDYDYEQRQFTDINNREYAMDLSGKRDGAYRAGSWALQDDDEEEEEEGYGGGGSQHHDYSHEEQDEEENPFDLSSRGNDSTRRDHQQSLTSTTYTPLNEPTNNTIFPALAGVSRRIDFTALASSSRANRGHSAAPGDSTTPDQKPLKSMMPPPATAPGKRTGATNSTQKKKRFIARAGSLSSSSSPTAVADPEEDDVHLEGGKRKNFNVKATPAEAAAAALSRSTKQTAMKALKTRSRTGRIVHGVQAAQGGLEMEKELERELEREVRLEQGLLGVPTPVGPGQGQGSGVEPEMSPATALVVDTARLQLISPPPEEILREKRRNAAQTTPCAPPPSSPFATHIPIAGSSTPATPAYHLVNLNPNYASNHSPNHSPNYSPNGTATKRKRTAAAQRQRQDQQTRDADANVDVEADMSFTPAGIPGYRHIDNQPSSSHSHSRKPSRQSRHLHDEEGHEQREEDLYPDPEATPNPKPRKMGRVQRGETDADASPTKSVSKSVSKSTSKSAAHGHSTANGHGSRNMSANLNANNDLPSSSSASRFDMASSSRTRMLLDESMDLDSDLLVGDSDHLRASVDEDEEDDEDVVMASPTKTSRMPGAAVPKTPSRSKGTKTPKTNTGRSRGRAPSPSPGRSRVRSVEDAEEEDGVTTPKAPARRNTVTTTPKTPRTARKTRPDASTSSRRTAVHSKATPKAKSKKGKGKGKAREESPLAETTDDDALQNDEEEEELALESDSGASDTSADLEMSRRRRDNFVDEDDENARTPRKSAKKMVLKSPHANKADADWVPDVVVRVRSQSPSRSLSLSAARTGDQDNNELEEEADALPDLPSPSALASVVKNAKASRRRSATPIPPYEPPPDVFTPPRVVYVQPPQSARKTPATAARAAKTPKTQTAKKRKPELKITPPHKIKIKTETPHSTARSGKKHKYPAYIDLTLAAPMDPPSPTDDPLLLSGPIGPPIGSSSPVKGGRWSRFGADNKGGGRVRVGEIPPWTPRHRLGLERMQEENEEEEEPGIIPISEEEDHERDGDDGVLPPSSEVDFGAEFGDGFASESGSGRSESPESRAQSVGPPASVAAVEAPLPMVVEMREQEHEEEEREDEREDMEDNEEPRFDLPSDRTDAQLPPSSPTLMALERSIERSTSMGVPRSESPAVRSPSPVASPSPRSGQMEEEGAVEVPEDEEEEMEEEDEEEGRVEVELGEVEEEVEIEDEEPSWQHQHSHDEDQGQETEVEQEFDVNVESHQRQYPQPQRDDTHSDRDDLNDFTSDILPPSSSSSPPRIHLLRPTSPVLEEAADLSSPQRRFGEAYGYEHGSVFVAGADVRVGVQTERQHQQSRQERERDDDEHQQSDSGGAAEDTVDEEVLSEEEALVEIEVESEVEVEVEESVRDEPEPEPEVEGEAGYMRTDADDTDDQDTADADAGVDVDEEELIDGEDVMEEEDVEDSMLHGEPGDEEVAPLPVFGFDFQSAVDAARTGDVDAEGWSSDDDAAEGEDHGDIDDETLHTMHAQMNSAALAASAAGLRGRALAMEEGEGTWTGRWRAIRVRTMMDPPSSATKGRMERWSERRRISPVPWVGERSRVVEEEEEEDGEGDEEQEEELSREEMAEEGEVEMSVFLDAGDDVVDTEVDANADPRAAASVGAIVLEPQHDFTEIESSTISFTSTPAQALQDRARAAARKSLVDGAGVSKTPSRRTNAYRPSWARTTPAYTVEREQDELVTATKSITTLPALLHEAEREVRVEQAFTSARAATPPLSLSPPMECQSPYDPANAVADDEELLLSPLPTTTPALAARKDKDNYKPFAFRTPTVPSDLSRSLWANAPSAVSTPAPILNTSARTISVGSEDGNEASTSKYHSSSIHVTSASIINEQHFDDFQEYPAASPDHSPHQSSFPSPFSTKDTSARLTENVVEIIDVDEEELDEEEEEYEYGYQYSYDPTWTGPGPRPWTRREWRLLDACYTDERIRLGRSMFPSLLSKFSVSQSFHRTPSKSFSTSAPRRRNSSLGRTKKDQEDADWDFDEGVSLLRGNPLASVEEVDVRLVLDRFFGAASGIVPLKSCEDDESDGAEIAREQTEEAERRVAAWGDGWDRDTLAARVEALERKQREGRVVRMRERLARRRRAAGSKRRATIGSTAFNTSFNSGLGVGSRTFAATTTSAGKGKGKEKEAANPFDFSFFREQEEAEEEERRAQPTTQPGPTHQDDGEDEHQHEWRMEVPDFTPLLRGRRGAAHPRRRAISGSSVGSSTSTGPKAVSASAPEPEPVRLEVPRTPRTTAAAVATKTPAKPTTPTAFPGLSSLRTRAASASPHKTRAPSTSPSKTSERRTGGGGSPRYSYLMEEAIRVHLGQESQEDQQVEEDMDVDVDVDEHGVDERQEMHDEHQEDDDEASESQSGDEPDFDEAPLPPTQTHQPQPRAEPVAVPMEAAPSPGLSTRVKGFLYSYLRPSSSASNLKSTSTSASTTARPRVVSTTSTASSSKTSTGASTSMGPAARARMQAQAQVHAKPTAKPSARAPTAQQTTVKPILRKGLPMQPPAILEARAKARTRTMRPVVTPARPPPVKPPHPKDVVRLHPPAASSSAHQHASNSNTVRLNTTATNGKARQIPVPIPRDLVRLNHVPPPVEKPVVDRNGGANERPGRPRSSAGSSVKDLVGVFEEMEREAAGSRAGFRVDVGVKPGVFAKDARAREAARKWRAEARDTRPRWR